MSIARPKRHRGVVASACWQWCFRWTLWLFLLASNAAALPAAAQTNEGGSPGSSGVAPEVGPASIGGGVLATPVLPGPAPETLPSPSIGGFGLPNPTAPPYSVNNEVPTLTSPPTLRLQPRAGVVPLQAYDPNAPAILIQPSLS